jgi:hypothetical protein
VKLLGVGQVSSLVSPVGVPALKDVSRKDRQGLSRRTGVKDRYDVSGAASDR